MKCQQIKDSLSAYLDDVLTAEETTEIRAHLDNCSDCRQELEDLKKTVSMLSSLQEIVPPASFRRELRRKLEQETRQARRPRIELITNIFAKSRRSYLFPVAAALVIMLVSAPVIMSFLNMPAGGTKMAREESVGFDAAANYKLSADMDRSVAPAAPMPGDEYSLRSKGEGPQGIISFQAENVGQTIPKEIEEVERKIIKNANLSLEVEDYNSAVESIKAQINSLGGYIANETVNTVGQEEILRGSIHARLPAIHFDSFLTGMEGVGKVKGREIYTQDVTEEYVDVESRLKAMRTKEERLLNILQKSGTLSDILAVENELANTRAQLESLEGRLRYLNNRVDYSSITINLRQVTASTQKITTGGFKDTLIRAKEAFIMGINNILRDAGKLIIYISSSLPYLILIVIFAFGVWWFFKKRNQ